MSRVITLTSRRIASLSSPVTGASVVWAISTKLSREDALFILQAKPDVPCE